MATKVENSGQCCNRSLTGAICNMIGVSLLVFDIQMESLQICGTFFMAIILQIPIFYHKLKWSVIYVDDHLLQQNIIISFSAGLQNGIRFLIIGGVYSDNIK